MTGWERAIGDGIYESLDVIAKEESSDAGNPTSMPARPGGYAPAVIILMTNGANNTGPSPLDAARLAAERGIRIYTIGLSSPSGTFDTSCQSSDPSEFGEGSLHSAAGPGGVDVKTLEQIAALTGATYFPASGLSGLKNVFQDAQLQTILVSEKVEVTVAFVGLGTLFAMISFLMALIWSPLL
jgi:Ca-activated chloride channel family protein